MTFEKDFYPYQSLFNLLYPSEALTGDDTKDGDTFSKGWSNDSHSDKWGAGPFVVSKSSDSEVTFTPNPSGGATSRCWTRSCSSRWSRRCHERLQER